LCATGRSIMTSPPWSALTIRPSPRVKQPSTEVIEFKTVAVNDVLDEVPQILGAGRDDLLCLGLADADTGDPRKTVRGRQVLSRSDQGGCQPVDLGPRGINFLSRGSTRAFGQGISAAPMPVALKVRDGACRDPSGSLLRTPG
jgi:hypothetical protein